MADADDLNLRILRILLRDRSSYADIRSVSGSRCRRPSGVWTGWSATAPSATDTTMLLSVLVRRPTVPQTAP